MTRFLLILICFAILPLAGCGTSKDDTGGPLTPMPDFNAVNDPTDAALVQSIEAYLKQSGGPASTRYDFTRMDLDHDSRRDALVMMKGPHHYWCDMNGCSMVVFKAGNDSFTPLSEVFPVRGPLYVSDAQTAGYRDLIIRVDGQAYAKAKDVALKFDGQAYPRNPFFLPEIELSRAEMGQRIFP